MFLLTFVVSEEASQTPQINEIEAEVLIGNEIPIMNLSDEISCQVSPNSCTHEEPSTRSAHFHEIDQHGKVKANLLVLF